MKLNPVLPCCCARWAGGVFITRDNSTVIVKDRSLFSRNVALEENSGGVAAMYEHSRIFVSDHCVFEENNATGSGESSCSSI
jgi:hypothetical protein